MTDLLLESFDRYGTGTTSNTRLKQSAYLTSGTQGVGSLVTCGVPSWGSAPTGPYCLVSPYDPGIVTGNPPQALIFSTQTVAPTQVFISFRFAMDALPSTNLTVLKLQSNLDQSNITIGTIKVTPTGVLNVYNQAGTLIVSTTNPVITAQEFCFIEFSADVSGNTFSLRINDLYADQPPELTGSFGSVYNSIGLITILGVSSVSSPTMYVDDLYIRDNSGSINNSWQGDRRILWIPVTKDTTAETWTVSASETFSIGSMPSDTMTISAVQFSQPMYTTSGTATEQGTFIGSLGATTAGTSHSLSTTPHFNSDIFNLDPDTSLALTPASLVNCQFSISLS